MKKWSLMLGFLSVSLLLWGCCHPPVKEISVAKAQLTEAKKEGALQYAPEKYKKAEALLAQSEAESKTQCRRSRKTVKLAEQAIQEAKEETLKVKGAAKDKAAHAIMKAEQALKDAKEAEAPQYAPDLYEVAEEALNQARKAFSGEDYFGASSKAEEACRLALKAKDAAVQVKKELEAKRKAVPATHEVAKGESLWRIAEYKKIYNDPFMWPLIYWANKAQIHDPDLIYPGQVFTIPRDFTGKEKDKAVRFAKQRGPWSLFDGR